MPYNYYIAQHYYEGPDKQNPDSRYQRNFLLTTADLLRQEGYECYCAKDAMTVTETLRSVKFDLLISDVNIPGNAELELIKKLPGIAEGLPVILVTSSPFSDTQIQSLKPPVTACLNKPPDFEELLKHVRSSIIKALNPKNTNTCPAIQA